MVQVIEVHTHRGHAGIAEKYPQMQFGIGVRIVCGTRDSYGLRIRIFLFHTDSVTEILQTKGVLNGG